MKIRFISIIILFSLLFSETINGEILFRENFTTSTFPTTWTNNIIQGSQGWLIQDAPAFSSNSGNYYLIFDAYCADHL